MATETNTLKDERINDTNTAANNTDTTSNEVKSETKEVVIDKKDLSKNNTFRMIGYPVVIGSVFGVGGLVLSNKLNKSKTFFVISGVAVGASLGFFLYKNWSKKQVSK